MGRIRVRAKHVSKNGLIAGFISHEGRKIYNGEVFEIPDDEVEVDEVIDGRKTGQKVKRLKYFSDRWMEIFTDDMPAPKVQIPVVAQSLPTRRGRQARKNDETLI